MGIYKEELDRKLEHFKHQESRKNLLYTAIVSIFISLGTAGITMNYSASKFNEHEIEELQQKFNSFKLEERKKQYSPYESSSLEFEFPFCICTKKESEKFREARICPIDRPVCDAEARKMCQQQLGDEYEC